MNVVIAKTLDTMISQAKKIPNFLLMVSIFTALFTKQAKSLYAIFIEISTTLFPTSLIETIHKINITERQFLDIWSALLVFMLIIFIWDIFKHLIENRYDPIILLEGENLIYLNSVILPSVFIYNKISDTPNKVTIEFFVKNLDSAYLYFVFIGFLVFLFIYAMTYLTPILGVFKTIENSNIKFRYKLILVVIYIIILSRLSAELGKTIIGL